MDDIDQAQFVEQRDLQLALTIRRPTLPATGFCHSCDAEIDWDRLFCDVECSQDYERAAASRARNGRR